MTPPIRWTALIVSSLAMALACGENPTVGQGPTLGSDEPDDVGDDGDTDNEGGGGGAGNDVDSDGGEGGDDDDGNGLGLDLGGGDDDGNADPEPDVVVDPCEDADCGSGQRCEVTDDAALCVDNECADLECSETEECRPAGSGGNRCVSIACDSDVECDEARHCSDAGICIDDVCTPGVRRCDGADLFECSDNGGADESAYSCVSPAYFANTCSAEDAGRIGCTCEDDWDCPEFTVCETGTCVGTGVEPTCTLPATPFENVLPELEFRWGGTDRDNTAATGRAFSWAGQVISTPMVINLNDDNGDGAVNELDFPEVLFMSTYGTETDNNGVVRAVHGGGTTKGEDYFALCGTTHWFEGDALIEDCDDTDGDDESRTSALGRSSGALAAGDLDGDGFPEIVVPIEGGSVQILNNRGEVLTTSPAGLWPSGNDWRFPAPAIANIDFTGPAEIIVGNRVITLAVDGTDITVDRVFSGEYQAGTMLFNGTDDHFGPVVCAADLTSDFEGLEIVAGTSAYRLPDVADCTAAPTSDYCEDRLTLLWDGTTVNPDDTFYPEGFCAVADVLGADTATAPGPTNALDEVPEVLVVADGRLLVFAAATGVLLRDIDLQGGDQGGAPNVDDFDGDGFPEIATALEDFYAVIDLQDPEATNCPAWDDLLPQTGAPPGTNAPRDPGGECESDDECNAGAVCGPNTGSCVCLHNGWRRDTEDDSSKVTSSSVFDFNGDGAAEVVYNDECYFRLYDGATGNIYLAIPSLSRTIIENPVVADVDNDGNAEIVFIQNAGFLQCDEEPLDSWPDGDGDVDPESLPNGLEVWGDPSDTWVAARRIWNQHSYHVTNVTEAGSIPLHEPESWKPFNGRLYNTYRSQPRNFDVAPDLALTDIQVSSPDVACGELTDEIQITVLVTNLGDLRVGPGVVIEFFGDWHDDPALSAALEDDVGTPITVTLDTSLEPGSSTLVSVTYVAGNNGRDDLPNEVRAVIDGADAERECIEDNNDVVGLVDPGEALADLRLVIDDVDDCESPEVDLTVFNDGALEASDVVVRIYRGDPSAGGAVLAEVTIPGPIAPGESESVTVELPSQSRDIVVWGVADPDNLIEECNDANNVAQGPELECDIILR